MTHWIIYANRCNGCLSKDIRHNMKKHNNKGAIKMCKDTYQKLMFNCLTWKKRLMALKIWYNYSSIHWYNPLWWSKSTEGLVIGIYIVNHHRTCNKEMQLLVFCMKHNWPVKDLGLGNITIKAKYSTIRSFTEDLHEIGEKEQVLIFSNVPIQISEMCYSLVIKTRSFIFWCGGILYNQGHFRHSDELFLHHN